MYARRGMGATNCWPPNGVRGPSGVMSCCPQLRSERAEEHVFVVGACKETLRGCQEAHAA